MEQTNERTIRKKARILCDGGSVEIEGYFVRLSEQKTLIGCKYCEMFYRCDLDMATICGTCDMITNKECCLELVGNNKK